MRSLPYLSIAFSLVAVSTVCGSSIEPVEPAELPGAKTREAWAVGTNIGGGSFLTGPSSCTYEAEPAVATLSKHHETGEPFMAGLVGPGTITEICGGTRTVHDVLAATALRIDGPATIAVKTEPSESYRVTPLAGDRVLHGVKQGGESPDWTLGPDCAGVATFGPVLGSTDTGGSDITRKLIAAKPGICTLEAKALGLSVTRAITVK